MSEEMNEYYVMVDEDGNEIEFQPVCTVQDEGSEYVVLIPRELDLEEEAGVVIMRIEDDVLRSRMTKKPSASMRSQWRRRKSSSSARTTTNNSVNFLPGSTVAFF